jgi:hypothetical protein
MSLPASAHRSFLVAFCNVATPDDTIKVKHLVRFLQGTEDKQADASSDWGHACGVNAASDAFGRRRAEINRRTEEEAKHRAQIAKLHSQIDLRDQFRQVEARIRASGPSGFWQRKIDILWAYMTGDLTLNDLALSFGLSVAMMEKEAQRGRVLFAKNSASEELMKAISR